ncbi:flavodoxin family protein [Paenibacillus methanolicus]|uniref:Multimeric flavodoxin WrbA n=1 Tax=Paenibacillus methanolicus TaxID=582686 RepID=A0A5S5C258_9BACL|nr:flavodoxin family protein [Paenibacillus methanolicus]TYP73394.1 multimeric flavodoxin WrbA [Paenibacillus methanolicus]
MSIAVIYGGTRAGGNTEQLAERALNGLEAERIYLKDYDIRAIEDHRHSEEGFRDRGDDYNAIIDRALRHDILLFATPIYWYGMSGPIKNFVDRWSQTLRDADRPGFREQMKAKTAYVIAVGGDQPLLKGLPLVLQFQHIFGFFGTTYGGYILGEGNRPGDIAQDREAMRKADLLHVQLKERLS